MSASQKRPKSPKRLMKDLFELKETARPLFIPLVYRYASKVSRMSVEEMLSRADNLSRSLMMARELFDYDAIVSHYDGYLELEMLGRSFEWANRNILDEIAARKRVSQVSGAPLTALSEVGQLAVVFESTEQICEAAGRETPVIGVLNGPVTLVRMILGDEQAPFGECRERLQSAINDARTMVLDFVKAYCNQRVDMIWLIEEDWSDITRADIEWLKPLYVTFWNVTQYFDVKALMAFHKYDSEDMEKYYTLGSDGLFFGGHQCENSLSARDLSRWVEKYGVFTGIACPYPEGTVKERLLREQIDAIRDIGSGFFLATPFEVPLEIRPDLINAIMDCVRE